VQHLADAGRERWRAAVEVAKGLFEENRDDPRRLTGYRPRCGGPSSRARR